MDYLKDYARSLPIPDDYLDGYSSPFTYDPRKIVFFSRVDSSRLAREKPFIHHRFNLVFALEGSLQIHIDKRVLTINEGESLLIFPYQNHYYSSEGDKEILWFFIGFDLIERRGLEKLKDRTIRTSSFVNSCLKEMINAKGTDKPHYLTAILVKNSSIEFERDYKEIGKGFIDDSLISRVQKIVYRDLSVNISPQDLVDQLGISESRLYKEFKRSIGISPGRYIKEVKINYGCSLLEGRRYNVTEVADLCGFESIYSFSRSFKQLTGVAPSQFKKNLS